MSDNEQSITPLSELLNLPEFCQGKHDPSKWPQYRRQKIAEDLSFRGIFPENSVPSLLPEQSNAQPRKINDILKALRLIGLATIQDLRDRELAEIDSLWKVSGTGRNRSTHRAGLSFWAEARQRQEKEH